MKQLLIVRHAKSSWKFPELADFDRPLLKKGIKRTKAIGAYMSSKQYVPDLIKTSSAKRAVETTKILESVMKLSNTDIEKEDCLYLCSVSDMIDGISKTDNKYNKLMIVGHNPTITDLANQMVGFDHIEWIVTAGLVIINFETDNWQEIKNTTGMLVEYTTPKELMDKD